MEHLHPAVSGLTLGDAVVHEHDLRGALEKQRSQGHRRGSTRSGTATRAGSGRRLRKEGLPTLEIKGTSETVVAGKDEPAGHVSASDFELFRALTGRRTFDEIRALDWTTDPEPYLKIFSPYRPPEKSLNEVPG